MTACAHSFNPSHLHFPSSFCYPASVRAWLHCKSTHSGRPRQTKKGFSKGMKTPTILPAYFTSIQVSGLTRTPIYTVLHNLQGFSNLLPHWIHTEALWGFVFPILKIIKLRFRDFNWFAQSHIVSAAGLELKFMFTDFKLQRISNPN